jgi:hypothetical protein
MSLARILRGEVVGEYYPRWGTNNRHAARRLNMSNDVFNERMQIVIAIALTSAATQIWFP